MIATAKKSATAERRKDLIITGAVLLLIFGFLGYGWMTAAIQNHTVDHLKESIAHDLPRGSSVDQVSAFLAREHLHFTPKLDTYPAKYDPDSQGGVYEMAASTGLNGSFFGAFRSGIYLVFVFDKHKKLVKSSVYEEGEAL